MKELVSLEAVVYGHVQGVFFRAFVSDEASKLGLTGYVCNSPEGTVEVHSEGDIGKLEELIGYLKIGPPGARVERVVTRWSKYSGRFSSFSIRY
jgi:acylphosphatase